MRWRDYRTGGKVTFFFFTTWWQKFTYLLHRCGLKKVTKSYYFWRGVLSLPTGLGDKKQKLLVDVDGFYLTGSESLSGVDRVITYPLFFSFLTSGISFF
jgi:hypothetical protein